MTSPIVLCNANPLSLTIITLDQLLLLQVPITLLLSVYLIFYLYKFISRHFYSKSRMSITVKWGREKLHIPLPPPDTKLSLLRSTLAEHTSLPPSSFKLIHAGAVMKDDDAPISVYGIRANSTIALIGGDMAAPINPSSPSRPTEQTTIDKIKNELELVRSNLVPSLDSFLSSLLSSSVTPTIDKNNTPPSKAELEQEHTRLGELFLQSLLRLDVINVEGEWTEARKERKVAVKEVQGLLEKLDVGWKSRREWIS